MNIKLKRFRPAPTQMLCILALWHGQLFAGAFFPWLSADVPSEVFRRDGVQSVPNETQLEHALLASKRRGVALSFEQNLGMVKVRLPAKSQGLVNPNQLLLSEPDLLLEFDPSSNTLSVRKAGQEKMFGLVGERTKPEAWQVQLEDIRLDRTLKRWGEVAGVRVRWDADKYVLIGAESTFVGDFTQAVSELLSSSGIRNSDYPLEACLYKNTPPLLRITRLGDQTKDCQ